MKKYSKHILEAIDRGIQIALDDYEDEGTINSLAPQKETIRNEQSVKRLMLLHEHFVDLGLPSGTLWCKYNLDSPISHVTNASAREERFSDALDAHEYIGGFYSWGEIEEKSEFIKKNYKFVSFKDGKVVDYIGHLTKYIDIDGQVLNPEDDAAYMSHQYPFEIRIPTKDQFEELKQNCEVQYIDSYHEIKGLHGVLFKSKINDKHVFFPLIRTKRSSDGRHYDSAFDGEDFGYWSSTSSVSPSEHDTAFALSIPKTHWYASQYTYTVYIQPDLRWYGMQIRPVTMEK